MNDRPAPTPRFLTLRAFRGCRLVARVQVVMAVWLLTQWNAKSAWIPSSSTANTFVPGDTPVWDDTENPPGQEADTADADSDGLPNWYEDWLGSNRYNIDTDRNGRGDLEGWLLSSAPDGDYGDYGADGVSNYAESASTFTCWRWENLAMISYTYTPKRSNRSRACDLKASCDIAMHCRIAMIQSMKHIYEPSHETS